MKITRPAIEQALSSISLPGAGKNLMEANAVTNINIFGDEVVVDVETDNPALQAKKKTEVSIMKAIHDQVNEKAKVKVNISVKATEKKDANLIKGKPIEGIQHIIAGCFWKRRCR
jgi:ATP-binding protein involved in chromosome partitioning